MIDHDKSPSIWERCNPDILKVVVLTTFLPPCALCVMRSNRFSLFNGNWQLQANHRWLVLYTKKKHICFENTQRRSPTIHIIMVSNILSFQTKKGGKNNCYTLSIDDEGETSEKTRSRRHSLLIASFDAVIFLAMHANRRRFWAW